MLKDTTAAPAPVGTAITHFVQDTMGRIISESDDAGTVDVEYIWLDDMVIAIITDVASTPVMSHIHTDHLGSPQKITNASDTIIWDPVLQPFGSVATASGTLEGNIRFPGQYFDGEAGFHQNWHRDYDPLTGRYIESDPIGLLGGINTYGYVEGNPLTFFDHNGLEVSGTFDKSTGTLTFSDNDTGHTTSASGFSGKPGIYSPAPNGTYFISDFPWGKSAKDNYFALLLDDLNLDDYADGYKSNYNPSESMSNIRLHSGYTSHACVTIPSSPTADPWISIQRMILNTSQGKPIEINGQSFPNYGTLEVTGSGHGAVP